MLHKQAKSRKEQIALTAIDIISEGGTQNLSMLKIAKRIGVTDAALYKHFKSKKIQNAQLNLDIGSDLFLQFKDREEYFPSYIIGLKPDAFIIIKTPTVLGKEYRLSEGRQIILRYKQLGELFRFNASVIESLDKPFKISALNEAISEVIRHKNSSVTEISVDEGKVNLL